MKRLAAMALGLTVFACQASAQDSVYTHLNEQNCRTLSETGEGGGYSVIQACDGHGDWTLYLNNGDHGSASAFSRLDTPPENMTYGGYVGNFGGFHTVIEWRLDDEQAAYATIHRYNSTSFDANGEPQDNSILIVAALRPGDEAESCHVGHVEATRLSGANALAREMADHLAPDFACGDPIWVIDPDNPDLENARRY